MGRQTPDLHFLPEDSPWREWLCCSENQLLHWYEPEPGLFIAETPRIVSRALAAGYTACAFLLAREKQTAETEAILAECPAAAVCVLPEAEMETLTGYHLNCGFLCALRRKPRPDAAEIRSVLQNAHRVAVLENTVNPTNLGAVFRSAAALGIDCILLSTGCTDPLYRRAARVSMGTVFQVPWTYLPKAPDASEAAEMLKKQGFLTAALALRENALPPDDARFSGAERLAVFVGTEGEGLSDRTISACDATVMIPMYHGVDSLNAAAASAVAFWAMRKRKD